MSDLIFRPKRHKLVVFVLVALGLLFAKWPYDAFIHNDRSAFAWHLLVLCEYLVLCIWLFVPNFKGIRFEDKIIIERRFLSNRAIDYSSVNRIDDKGLAWNTGAVSFPRYVQNLNEWIETRVILLRSNKISKKLQRMKHAASADTGIFFFCFMLAVVIEFYVFETGLYPEGLFLLRSGRWKILSELVKVFVIIAAPLFYCAQKYINWRDRKIAMS